MTGPSDQTGEWRWWVKVSWIEQPPPYTKNTQQQATSNQQPTTRTIHTSFYSAHNDRTTHTHLHTNNRPYLALHGPNHDCKGTSPEPRCFFGGFVLLIMYLEWVTIHTKSEEIIVWTPPKNPSCPVLPSLDQPPAFVHCSGPNGARWLNGVKQNRPTQHPPLPSNPRLQGL